MDADPAALPDDIEALKAACWPLSRADAGANRSRCCPRRAIQRPCPDRASEAADRETQARDVRPALPAQHPATRSDGIATGRTGGDSHRGRTCSGEGGGQDHPCRRVQPQRGARKPFPEHLPRERVVVPGPTACACCGGARRWCTRQTKGKTAPNPSYYTLTGWRRTESGRPAANIWFNTATPTAASVCWAAKPRARNEVRSASCSVPLSFLLKIACRNRSRPARLIALVR